MRLMIDGLCFQIPSSEITSLWTSLLQSLSARATIEVFLLDRGGAPTVPGATIIPFPAYLDRYTADDSFLIQKICEHYAIEVFTSTGYTTPISIPMILLVHDSSSEFLHRDLSERALQEKELAIAFARRFIALSRSPKRDLLRDVPGIGHERIAVTEFAHRDSGGIQALPIDVTIESDHLVSTIESEAESLVREAKTGAFDGFFSTWRRLRAIQAGVDLDKIL